MYILRLLFLSLLLFFIEACNYNRNENNVAVYSENDTCNNVALTECIVNYINEVPWKYYAEITPVFSVYFFKDLGIDWFTIWTFITYPNYIENNIQNIILEYKVCNIQNRNVVFIYNIESSEIRNIISSKFNVNRKKDSTLFNPDINYDGSWFPKTYSYTIVDSCIYIEESDTILVPFLGDD